MSAHRPKAIPLLQFVLGRMSVTAIALFCRHNIFLVSTCSDMPYSGGTAFLRNAVPPEYGISGGMTCLLWHFRRNAVPPMAFSEECCAS